MHSTRQTGFSLVELSIVLVILGLLVGGVMGGQSLIKAAELRSVGNDFVNWQTATNAFRAKYNALPGDFRDASRFWPGVGNGNGNGIVTRGGVGGGEEPEFFLFWQHLSLAGLIPGQYTGVSGGGTISHHVPGQNVPMSRYKNAGWTAESVEGGHSERFEHSYLNSFLFGRANWNLTTADAILTPEDAWNIDSKFDDGRPGQGHVIAHRIHTCTNASNHHDLNADYLLSSNQVVCTLYFRSGI